MERVIELDGTNRGGRLHAGLLLERLDDRSNVEVRLVDPAPGRAKALVPLFEARGIKAIAEERDALLTSDADVRVLGMDDIHAIIRIVMSRRSNGLVLGGILASAPIFGNLGGSVLGLQWTLPQGAEEKQKETGAVLERLSELSPGERTASRKLTRPVLQTSQAPYVRRMVHKRLTQASVQFLEDGSTKPEVAVVDGFAKKTHPVTVVEASRNTLRRELRAAAIHEILTQGKGNSSGVVFYDRREAWLYCVLAELRDSWKVCQAIELPIIPPSRRTFHFGTGETTLQASRRLLVAITD